MSDKPIPKQCTHDTIVRTTDNMNCDPWWWECDDCGKQLVDREQLARAEAALSEAQNGIDGLKEFIHELQDTINQLREALLDIQKISDPQDDSAWHIADAALAQAQEKP